MRCDLDAVSLRTEVGNVEVSLENLPLAPCLFESKRVAKLSAACGSMSLRGPLVRSSLVVAVSASTFLTYCCVIVEPPWVTLPASVLATSARSVPRRSIPLCS